MNKKVRKRHKNRRICGKLVILKNLAHNLNTLGPENGFQMILFSTVWIWGRK